MRNNRRNNTEKIAGEIFDDQTTQTQRSFVNRTFEYENPKITYENRKSSLYYRLPKAIPSELIINDHGLKKLPE